MARSLRFQAGLALKYWGECAHAAVYITNMLTNLILGDKSHHEVMYKERPKNENMGIFGCLVVAANPNNEGHKFDARCIPCLFLGYPQTQKGYKLMNLFNWKMFVTREAILYENIYPYHVFHTTFIQSSEDQTHQPNLTQPWIYDDSTSIPTVDLEPNTQLLTKPLKILSMLLDSLDNLHHNISKKVYYRAQTSHLHQNYKINNTTCSYIC